jgi:predicted nucleic acid binding AN1-type Zn finger protein
MLFIAFRVFRLMQPAAQGICPRCSIEGDKNSKTLYRCPFCGGYFCEKHSEPRLVMSFQTYQAYVAKAYADRDRGLAALLESEWRKEGGHPCPEYTREFWRRREARLEPPPEALAETGEAASALTCDYCGRVITGFSYECKLCHGIFCAEHAPPEKHECYKLELSPPEEAVEPMKCEVCGAAALLYRCNYCGGLFCAKHHLPPNHDCPNLHLWKAKPPPGLTMRYEGRRYASVDVPVASEPRAPAAAERAGYNPQLDMVRPYNRVWRKVPVEGDEEEEPAKPVKVAVREPSKSSDKGWANILLPIFLAMFIVSFIALYNVSEAYAPFFFLLLIVSLIGTVATFLSMTEYEPP